MKFLLQSQENIQTRRASKVKPSNDDVVVFHDKQAPEKQNLEHFSTSSKYAGIQNLLSVSTSPSTKIKKKHLESINIMPDDHELSSQGNQKSFHSMIETSIRQKSDLEKWSKFNLKYLNE